MTALLLSVLSPLAPAAEPEIKWGELQNLAQRYLKECCAETEVAARAMQLRERVAQRMKDNEVLSEDAAMRELTLDWAMSNQSKFWLGDKEAVEQGCVLFVALLESGSLLPKQIRSQFTPKALKAITDYLEGQIATAHSKEVAGSRTGEFREP
jgi:hypothetical protein